MTAADRSPSLPAPDVDAATLDALTALLDAATDGPWCFDGLDGWIATEEKGDPVVEGITMWREADADLIVALRNAAPALVALARAGLRVPELEAENERLTLTDTEFCECPEGAYYGAQMLPSIARCERCRRPADPRLGALQQRLDAVLGQVGHACRLLALSGQSGAAATVRAQVERWPEFVDAAALDVSPVPSQPAPETQPTNEARTLCLSRHGGWFQHVADRHPCADCRRDAARQQDEPARAEEEQA